MPRSLAGQLPLASQQPCRVPHLLLLSVLTQALPSLPYSRLDHIIKQLWLPVACTGACGRGCGCTGLDSPLRNCMFSALLSLIRSVENLGGLSCSDARYWGPALQRIGLAGLASTHVCIANEQRSSEHHAWPMITSRRLLRVMQLTCLKKWEKLHETVMVLSKLEPVVTHFSRSAADSGKLLLFCQLRFRLHQESNKNTTFLRPFSQRS